MHAYNFDNLAPNIRRNSTWPSPAMLVSCPVCGDANQHHSQVFTFDRMEDGDTEVWSNKDYLAKSPTNPSPRRDAVRIMFTGECGHDWWLDLVQHKGQSFLFVGR